MGMIGPDYSTKPAPKKRPAWVTGGITILTFVALLYVIEVFNQMSGDRLEDNGIRPLQPTGCGAFCFRRCCMRIGST